MENWKRTFIEQLIEFKSSSDPDTTLISVFSSLCEIYPEKTFSAVRSFYYRRLCDLSLQQLKDLISDDDSSNDVSSCCREGDIIKTNITGYAPYGVFLQSLDDSHVKGLLHISKMDGFTLNDIEECSSFDTVVMAKIIKIDEDGKFYFSLQGVKGEFRDKLQSFVNKSLISQPSSDTDSLPQLSEFVADELDHIVDYVSSLIGPVSDNAKSLLQELISDYGVFKFTLGLTNTYNSFKPDPSYQLLSDVHNLLKEVK